MRELHLNYLLGLKAEGRLLCAGPMTDYTWALFIYMADCEEGAKALVEDDPFLRNRYITDYEINQWHHRV